MNDLNTVAADMVRVSLECDDLDAALDYFTDELGFRVLTIFPADSPRVATISADGIHATIERSTGDDVKPDLPPSLVITSNDENEFVNGRAGMQYRDLIPGRYDGRFIASHIRIPAGGPVNDYVHHHDIHFQMIFCVNGWVRVAYEDQGEPMLMSAGDCFLQPPHIRHRVLESSDAMEVVEITCPAEHETAVDHEMTLPTGNVDANRKFGGQSFVFFESSKTPWQRGAPGFESTDTGIASASGNVASAVVARATEAGASFALTHDAELRFVYVLDGSARLAAGDSTELVAGHSCAIPPGEIATLENVSEGFEFLDVSVPSSSPGQ